MTSTPHPPIEALKTLYDIGLEKLLLHDTLETPKGYQFCDLEEQILKDCHNMVAATQHIKRKE